MFAPVFTYPLGFSLALLAAGFILSALKRKRSGKGIMVGGILILYLFSTDAVSHLLVRNLEARYNPLVKYPQASAIVLLGGAGVSPEKPRIYPESNDFGDRIFAAARIYKQKASALVITSGGYHDWFGKESMTEATINKRLLVDVCGVDSNAVLCENTSANTADHGPTIGKMLDSLKLPRSIILVTSAVHMERSVRVFNKNGYTIIPAPTDFRASAQLVHSIADFLPSSGALYESTMALHEYYGLIAYTVLGWI